MRITTLSSATKHSKSLLHLLKPQNPSSPFLLRHLSIQSNPQLDDSSSITQIVQLLQSPQNEWNTDHLRTLLYSDSGNPPPARLFHITRRLDSSSKALQFFDYVHANSNLPEDLPLLSSTFQAVLELASREPNWQKRLLELYRTSKERNFPLSINGATLLLRRFGRAGMRDEVLLVFKELDPLCKNTHVCNLFVEEALRLGDVDEALQVLDEMLEPSSSFPPNAITGDIVFSRLLRRQRAGRRLEDEEIVGLVSKFGEHGMVPDTVKLTQLITNFCVDHKNNRAWDVLDAVMKSGSPVEAAPCNALLTGLGKANDFTRMNELMAKMKEMDIQPNVVTFGILINRLCKSRRVDEALEVFEKMSGGESVTLVEPDVITYNTLIDGLCKVGRQEEGLRLMEQMRSQKNCAPNTVTYNCLIDGFNKVGEIERALELFDQMKKEEVSASVITLNTLIDGMCRHGRINRAVEVFNEMGKNGIMGNTVTYTILITAFCNVNNISKAMELFDQMLRTGCSADAIIYYSLISGLSQAGRMDDASMVVSQMKEAGFCMDTVSYNVLISGFCKKNKLDEAYKMLKEMEETGIKPDTVTYNTLIGYLSKIGSLKIAHRVMQKMRNDGFVPTVVTYGALIHGYCLQDKTDEAMKVFKAMKEESKIPPNTVIYNMLIDALCKKNKVELALSLMDDMKVREVKPNTTTYNAMFKGLRANDLLNKAFYFMDRMVEQACNPDYITMDILTEWLSAVGETEKLRKFVQGYEVSTSTA
ncbi:hypothetical protein UlMin_022545 [Ulmus minor]